MACSNQPGAPYYAQPMAKLLALFLATAAVFVTLPVLVRPSPPPPDIVLIIVDDLSRSDLDLIHTPNLDALAASGVTFTRGYSMPTCAPTRWSMLYGEFNPRHFRSECRDNPTNPFPHPLAAPILDPSRPNLSNVLTAAGYTAGFFGKWHTGSVMSGWQNAPLEVGFTAWRAGGPPLLSASGGACNSFGFYDWQRVDDGTITQETGYATKAQVDAAIDWASGTPGPRFAIVSFHSPHIPLHLPPEEVGRTDREQFEAMVRNLDVEVGRLLGAIPDDAWVFFIADNGTFSGNVAPGVDPDKAKRTTFEGGINVPVLVRGPGVLGGRECGRLVCTTDILATLAEIVGAPPPLWAEDSLSFLPLVHGPTGPPTRTIGYAGHVRDDGTEHDEAAFTERYKLRRVFGVETLYDLKADPLEENPLPAGALPGTWAKLSAFIDAQ